MSGHTPGPWWTGTDRPDNDRGYGGYLYSLHIYAGDPDQETKIAWASCSEDGAQMVEGAPGLDEARANAALIAAAPETAAERDRLKALVQELVKSAEYALSFEDVIELGASNDPDFFDLWLNDTRAALERARGKG